MDQGLAAALAAGIAAIASVLTLVFNLRASSRSAMRAAHRDAIRVHLESLSENIHTVVASVVVMSKRAELGSDVRNWQEKGKAAGAEIGSIRRRTAYLLPRLGPAMRQLELASDHVATYGSLPETNVSQLIAEYQQLSDRLNDKLARTYWSGKPTPQWRSWAIKRNCDRIDQLWDGRPRRSTAVQSR